MSANESLRFVLLGRAQMRSVLLFALPVTALLVTAAVEGGAPHQLPLMVFLAATAGLSSLKTP
jgi:hypothetical protein